MRNGRGFERFGCWGCLPCRDCRAITTRVSVVPSILGQIPQGGEIFLGFSSPISSSSQMNYHLGNKSAIIAYDPTSGELWLSTNIRDLQSRK